MQFLSKPRVAKQCLILHGQFDFCLDTFGLWELLWEAFVRGRCVANQMFGSFEIPMRHQV